MFSSQALKAGQVVIGDATYFVVGGKLVAAVFNKAELTVKVSIEVVYDEKWETVFVPHNGLVAIVFTNPPTVGSSVGNWLSHLGMFDSFWVIGAFNGVCFCADYLPVIMLNVPHFENVQSSDMEMDGQLDERHQLARLLIEQTSGQPWNDKLVEQTQAAQAQSFIAGQMQP